MDQRQYGGGQPGQYGGQPGQYGGQPGQYGNRAPQQYGGQYNAPQQYGGGGYPPQYPQQNGSAGFAIASMVLGIVSLVLSCCIPYLPGVLALIGLALGGVALGTGKPGKGMAIAGVVCSIIALVPVVITIVWGASLMSAIADSL